jgi:hypothetical protein
MLLACGSSPKGTLSKLKKAACDQNAEGFFLLVDERQMRSTISDVMVHNIDARIADFKSGKLKSVGPMGVSLEIAELQMRRKNVDQMAKAEAQQSVAVMREAILASPKNDWCQLQATSDFKESGDRATVVVRSGMLDPVDLVFRKDEERGWRLAGSIEHKVALEMENPAPPAPAQPPPAPLPPPTGVVEAPLPSTETPPEEQDMGPPPDEAAIRAFVTAWKGHWEHLAGACKTDGYQDDYEDSFVGPAPASMNKAAWLEDKRVKTCKIKHLSVGVEDLQIDQTGETATARFRQRYQADAYSDVGTKVLTLSHAGGKWAIVGETFVK